MSNNGGKARAVTESPVAPPAGANVQGFRSHGAVLLAVHPLDLGPGHPLPVTVRDLARVARAATGRPCGSARMAAVSIAGPTDDAYTAATPA